MSSSTGDPNDAEDSAVAMDTTEEEQTTTIWEQARQNSSQMNIDAVLIDLENQASAQREEIRELRQRAEASEADLGEARKAVAKLEAEARSHESARQGLETRVRESSHETGVLRESIANERERADRSGAESDRLREEISRLTKSNQSYQKQLADAEAQAKLDDSSLLPLQFKNNRIETENDNLRTHSTWLEGELREKTEELVRLRSSTSLEAAQSRASVEAAQSERDETALEAQQLREQLERLQAKTEGMSRELLDAKQEVSDVRLDSEEELTASRRLIDMQKEQILRLGQKHDGLAAQMESMKALAGEAENQDMVRWNEREQQLKEVSQRVLKETTEEYENKLESMQKEVQAANQRCKRAEDGLLMIEGPATTKTPPRRALPPVPDENSESLSLTDLYGRVAQAEDALHAETIRRKKAEIQVSRIEAEIKANAPRLVRQRKEFEMAMQKQTELQSRVEDALDEAAASRNECSMLQAEVARLKSENTNLTEEGKELAKQVQAMLIARSSGVDNPNVAMTVAQMQSANQRLLKEYREMTVKVKDLEEKLKQEDIHQENRDLKAQLAAIEEDRQRQEVLVEGIVQQRDLYRALVKKQDSNLLAGGEESSALAIVNRQSQQTKVLEQKHNLLIKQHAEAKAKLDVLTRDHEAASERLMRYELLNGELTKSVDAANMEISKDKAAVARSEAEANFYKDKAKMLEEAQQRNRDEIKNVTSSKNRIMVLNTNLEQSISKANGECSRMEDQLRQAKSKLLLAEAEATSAKSAEKRISDEANQLRNELARQGAVLEGVQRIESSLVSKNNAEMESYKLEIASLKEKMVSTEKKQETALVDLREKITDQELQLKQLETSRANAAKEALEAKKESLSAVQKANEATKKSSVLEGQLKIAKKKLGETDGTDEKDVETELRTKLETLSTDLEGAQKEVETWKSRSATYEKLAKDNETAVADLTEASNLTKKSLEESIAKLKEELERTDTEMTKRKEVITELTNDLSAQREERETAVNEVKKQIAGFKADAEKHQKKAEEAESRFVQLQNDVSGIQSDLVEAQSNYERELALHAAVRTDLRAAREESEKANRLRNTAMEEAATLQSKFKVQESRLEAEKSKLEEAEKEFEKKISASRAENTLLHTQLEKINDQIEKIQSRSAAESTDADSQMKDVTEDDEMMKLRLTVSELRELVKFVRAEKDAMQGQLDASRRSTERERTKASVARRAAEESQAELKTLKESMENSSKDANEGGTSMAAKLKATEEQSRLLGDSNAHLQQQVQELQKNLASTRSELETSKNALQPATDTQKELEADKAAMLAEKESLLREINDWKGRVQSLVSRFNQVDPEEHAKLVKKAQELETQVKSLEQKKASAEQETTRIRTLASRASNQLSQNKQMVENQKKSIAKLTAEKAALVKSQKESTSKKDVEELNQKVAKLEKEKENQTIQLKGSTEMNEKLRDRLRHFQKTMLDLRKEKEALTSKLTEAQSKAKQKEAEIAKATVALKQKESALESALQKSAAASSVATAESTTVIAKAKPAPVIAKPTAAASATSSDTKTAIEKKDEKQVMPKVPPGGFKFAQKEEKPVMPKVPPGGFKFAPSKTQTVTEKKDVASIASKKRPATEIAKEDAPALKIPASVSQSSEGKGDGAPTAGKDPSSSPKRPPPPNRRNSREVKEMSLKDKLLEKKRKLMELKKAKEAKAEEAKAPEPVSTEQGAKRSRTDSKGDGKAAETSTAKVQEKPKTLDAKAPAFLPKVSALKEAAAAMAAKASPKSNTSQEGSASNEAGELKEGDVKPLLGQTSTIGGGAPSSGSVFGGTKAPSAFGSAFGSGSTSTFGQSSGFGSTTTGFGSAAASAGKSTFSFGGAKSDGGSASTSGFGGAAFLNIKPPGSSSGTAPKFSFGSSSSITLPTPGPTAPTMNAFNAFSPPGSSNPFGGQVAAKPLFGSTQEKEKKEEKEDGEMPGSEDTTK